MIRKDGIEERPATPHEQSADTAYAQDVRAMLDTLHGLEREREALNSLFFAYQTPRSEQLRISQRLDEIDALINAHRHTLASQKSKLAKTSNEQIIKNIDPLEGFGRNAFAARRRDQLSKSLRASSIEKSDVAPVETTMTGTQERL